MNGDAQELARMAFGYWPLSLCGVHTHVIVS